MNRESEQWLYNRLRRLKSVEGYELCESIERRASRLNLKIDDCVRINANENLLISKEFISSILREVCSEVDPRLYPVDEPLELIDRIAERLNLTSEYVNIGNGSDQLIDLLVNSFLHEDEGVITISPTFSFYRLRTHLAGSNFREVSLRPDFSLNVDAILDRGQDSRICFICSPNNPTGNQFPIDDVKKIIESFRGLVVLDEAYADFAEYSLTDLVKKYENLVVMRTFSKAFGAAGARLGYMLADPNISILFKKKIQYPYGVNSISCKLCTRLLERYDHIQDVIREVRDERSWLTDRVNLIDGARAFPSQANFILIQLQRSVEDISISLMKKGVFVRKIGRVLDRDNCIRVTVGTREMNRLFLEALGEAL